MNFLNDLKEKGYLWAIMPKRNRKRFFVTKANTINGQYKLKKWEDISPPLFFNLIQFNINLKNLVVKRLSILDKVLAKHQR